MKLIFAVAMMLASFAVQAQIIPQPPNVFRKQITSMAASGATALSLQTGAKLDLGAGTSDHLTSNGTNIVAAGGLAATTVYGDSIVSKAAATLVVKGSPTDAANAVAIKFQSTNALTGGGAKIASFYPDNGVTEKAYIGKDGEISVAWLMSGGAVQANGGTVKWGQSPALATCAAIYEGYVYRQGGGTSGSRTKLCFCTSDGAGTPVYAWQNVISGAIGNTTTCP